MKIESAGLSTCDARLDDEAQRCGLHVRESGRLWRKLEKVRVQLRGGAHAQVAEFGYTVLRVSVTFANAAKQNFCGNARTGVHSTKLYW